MYKLVLVDDEVEIRSGLAQYFPWNQLGFTIAGTFGNGREALDYILGHPVDVLLCDIAMPVMDGLELARTLHESGRRIRIVLLSAHKEFEYARKALAYDVRSYIVKPTGFEELYGEFSKIRSELDEAAAAQPHDGGLSDSDNGASFHEKVIETIKRYVEQHYAEASLDEAARLVRMNPDYVSKFFKTRTGRNFSDYIVEVRMNKAAELLRDIRYKTFEISEMVGYSYPKNFTRTFRKYFGMSPREYRNGREQERSPE
ncbi:response regulator [Paenibacillus sepulcri]|uniref:Response regulator n=1 Tax=Paenibacillus sepulcri TaxID=359917 RepID=A0ABS7C972_9BACL|nr:response regulator [Paenibacillus sepulcri]